VKLPDIYTIGVYESSEKEFFQILIDNNIDTFCDIRRRRAVRGSEYAFVNSKRLQDKLENLSINYLHELGLAPTNEIRHLQLASDDIHKVPHRQRTELDSDFKEKYLKEILSQFDFEQFFTTLDELKTKRLVFFCVEKSASACHRSLVTNKIQEMFPRIKINHL